MGTRRDTPISINPGDSTAGSSHTNWKAIFDAASSSATASKSREAVAQRYWGVIYAYVRRSGIALAESDDVTQAFIADVLLGRNLLATASPDRGRFRSLLLASVRNYCVDHIRRSNASTRKPDGWVMSIGESDVDLPDSATPERAFNLAWVHMLIASAAEEVKGRALSTNREMHWDIFDRRVLQPALVGAEPVSTEAFMRQWSISSPVQVANIVARMKRTFTAALMAELGNFDDDADSVATEVSTLLSAIGGACR
jgi:RNA polymerase sigma-70 factor (ECF subfamily)